MSTLLQKILKILPLTATGPEVYVATMTNVLSGYYYSLVDNINHMKSLKLKDHMGVYIADCCDAILINVDRLESSAAFKAKHLVYIICIFEDTSYSIFHIWETQMYKEVITFVKETFIV